MSTVKASVILTSYNKPKYLKRAIESCLVQDYPNLEIIIADDNSPNPDVWNVINSPRLLFMLNICITITFYV